MEKYIKVESDKSLVRDVDSNAIINNDKSEFDKFIELSRKNMKKKGNLTICVVIWIL